MLTQFSLYNESETTQWDHFVESHPKGTPYHLSAWLKTLQETYSFVPLMYVVKDTDHNISGIFPFFLIKSLLTGSRIVSLPFSDTCGPLFNDPSQEKDVLAEIIQQCDNQIKYIEIRAPHNRRIVF